MMTTGGGSSLRRSSSTPMPPPPGIRISRMMTSGFNCRTEVMASAASWACPTISTPPTVRRNAASLFRTGAESSAITTLTFFCHFTPQDRFLQELPSNTRIPCQRPGGYRPKPDLPVGRGLIQLSVFVLQPAPGRRKPAIIHISLCSASTKMRALSVVCNHQGGRGRKGAEGGAGAAHVPSGMRKRDITPYTPCNHHSISRC